MSGTWGMPVPYLLSAQRVGAMAESKDESQWQMISKIMPEAKELEKELRSDLYGLVRRTILKEKELAAEATAIYRPDRPEELTQLINQLPYFTEDEIARAIGELQLSQEEEELEASHWVFNHQATRGEMMSGETLIAFKLVRLYEYAYLLICDGNYPEVVQAFDRAFGRPYAAFSEKALFIDDHHWSAWAWFTHPDDMVNQQNKVKFTELWKENG